MNSADDDLGRENMEMRLFEVRLFPCFQNTTADPAQIPSDSTVSSNLEADNEAVELPDKNQ